MASCEKQSIAEIREESKTICGRAELNEFIEDHSQDPRSGVQKIIASTLRRIEKEEAELDRVKKLYEFEANMREDAESMLSVGLDEVGRGPLAGPLAIGAVVLNLDDKELIEGLNDSKKIAASKRDNISDMIKERAIAYDVVFVDAREIDEIGISKALRKAFLGGVSSVENQLRDKGYAEDSLGLVCLDGNPMGLDPREKNVIKGDAKVASIAAASIIAKVERDALMEELDEKFPGYGLAQNKGYGSDEHIKAIKDKGLSPVHRASFCRNFV